MQLNGDSNGIQPDWLSQNARKISNLTNRYVEQLEDIGYMQELGRKARDMAEKGGYTYNELGRGAVVESRQYSYSDNAIELAVRDAIHMVASQDLLNSLEKLRGTKELCEAVEKVLPDFVKQLSHQDPRATNQVELTAVLPNAAEPAQEIK